MGVPYSVGYNAVWYPEEKVDVKRPGSFDPYAGFEKGRKERKMLVTDDQMDHHQMGIEYRDYCAHKFFKWQKCVNEGKGLVWPFGRLYVQYNCFNTVHEYTTCQYQDSIMRLKEFERERRLLRRLHRKREQYYSQQQDQEWSEINHE